MCGNLVAEISIIVQRKKESAMRLSVMKGRMCGNYRKLFLVHFLAQTLSKKKRAFVCNILSLVNEWKVRSLANSSMTSLACGPVVSFSCRQIFISKLPEPEE